MMNFHLSGEVELVNPEPIMDKDAAQLPEVVKGGADAEK